MTKRDKRLRKLRNSPKNIRKEELDDVLRDYEFTPDFTSGSHTTYRHPSGARVTVAVHGPLVPPYIVRQAIAAIDQVLAEQQDEDDKEENEEGEDEQSD